MSYLIDVHIGWLVCAALLGGVVGWTTWQQVRERWMDRAVWIAVGAIVVAMLVAVLKLVPGRAGYWLDLALLMIWIYGFGCALGWVLHDLLFVEIAAGAGAAPRMETRYLARPSLSPSWPAVGGASAWFLGGGRAARAAATPTAGAPLVAEPTGASSIAAPGVAAMETCYLRRPAQVPSWPAVGGASAWFFARRVVTGPGAGLATGAAVETAKAPSASMEAGGGGQIPPPPGPAASGTSEAPVAPAAAAARVVDGGGLAASPPTPDLAAARPAPARPATMRPAAAPSAAAIATPGVPVTAPTAPSAPTARLSPLAGTQAGDHPSETDPASGDPAAPEAASAGPGASSTPVSVPAKGAAETGSAAANASEPTSRSSGDRPGTPSSPTAPAAATSTSAPATSTSAPMSAPMSAVSTGAGPVSDSPAASSEGAAAGTAGAAAMTPTSASATVVKAPEARPAAVDAAAKPTPAAGERRASDHGLDPSSAGAVSGPGPSAPAGLGTRAAAIDTVGGGGTAAAGSTSSPAVSSGSDAPLATPAPSQGGVSSDSRPSAGAMADSDTSGPASVTLPSAAGGRSGAGPDDPATFGNTVSPDAATAAGAAAAEPGPGPAVAATALPASAESDPAPAPPLPDEANHPGTRPPGFASPRGGTPDDLKRIKGIGKQNEGRLHGLGVWHFAQIAAWSAEEARWVGSYLAFHGRIEREKWIDQAAELAAGHETAFSRRAEAGLVATSKDDGSHGQGNVGAAPPPRPKRPRR